MVAYEDAFYVCNLKEIINGPPQQTLSRWKACFQRKLDVKALHVHGVKLMSENTVADLKSIQTVEILTLKLSLYRFKLKQATEEGKCALLVTVMEPVDDTYRHEGLSNLACHILPNDYVAVGYFVKPSSLSSTECLNGSSLSVKLRLFRNHSALSEATMLADSTHEIDKLFAAKLPVVIGFRYCGDTSINFGYHKNKIFGMVHVRNPKPFVQVYCFHRREFLAIGGSNCGKSGLYVMKSNARMDFYRCSGFKGLRCHGWTSEIDFKREVSTYKFFEWTLSF